MITSTLSQLHWYKVIGPNFAKAIDFALNTDFSTLGTGLLEIDGENVFAMINEYSTRTAADCEWESHQKYADIQLMISGVENFGYTPLAGQRPVAAYHSDNDVVFYAIPAAEASYITLYPGQFIIFFPSDIHQPEVFSEVPIPVRKVVMKVKV
ncbi:MAG: YhcH/YjgK/YiaL family protein [Puia sp.]|nr:YhcH/YjgK/YiaL family protein [Puia sp.]